MKDKEFVWCKVKLRVPNGQITCNSCIFCARSCVTATHCSVTGNVIPNNEKGRILSCPLEPL